MRLPLEAVAIVGPTASGKSSLAERVAAELHTSIVSVDAMQVYRGMDIGTAKSLPTTPGVELLMVDVADISQDYSVSLFQRDARVCVDGLLARGVPAVLCGGTGLYLDAVIDEMEFPTGETRGETRSRYEAIAEEQGADALHALLAARDPKSAELIHPRNVRRVVRALEMYDEGVSYAEQNANLRVRAPHYRTAIWGITMDRARLYRRIDERVDVMFEAGLVDEVVRLVERGLRDSVTARQAIGYKEVLDALDGTITMQEARELVKARTRRYAKRQLSWLRRDGRTRWLDYDMTSEDEAVQAILRDVERGC